MPSKRPRRRIERLGSIDEIVLVRVIGATEDAPSILSNMASAASVRTASISRANTNSVAKRRGVSKRESRWAREWRFPWRSPRSARDECASRDRADAEFPHGFKPFDKADEVSLARRFRPSRNQASGVRSSSSATTSRRFQSRDRLWRQALDEILVCPFSRKGARRQGDPFQFERRGKQDARSAQIFDHRRDDHVAAIRADRFVQRDMKRGRASSRRKVG